MRSEPAVTPWRASLTAAYPICGGSTSRFAVARRVRSERSAGAAQAPEDHERVLRQGLVDELTARLGLAVQPFCELLGLLFRSRAHEDVRVSANDAVALRLELVAECLRLLR